MAPPVISSVIRPNRMSNLISELVSLMPTKTARVLVYLIPSSAGLVLLLPDDWIGLLPRIGPSSTRYVLLGPIWILILALLVIHLVRHIKKTEDGSASRRTAKSIQSQIAYASPKKDSRGIEGSRNID